MSARAQSSWLDRPDGARVLVRSWSSDGGPPARGVVQIVHGLAEHCARYARFAEALVNAGFVVVASDHRGHGETAPTLEDLGHFADEDGFTRVVDDLVALGAWARSEHPGLPFVLFGHSMGSLLACHVVVRDPAVIAAVVLTGPTGQVGPIRKVGRQLASIERWRIGKRGRSALLHAMSFGDFNRPFAPARTSMDWLSRDPVEVDRYVADPRCGFVVTAQFWCDLLDGMETSFADAFVRQLAAGPPMLVLAGGADPVGGMGRQVRAYFDRVKSASGRVRVEVLPEARHELLNEISRDAVTADILGWLSAQIGS